jgi:hypothetical protein
MPLAPVNSTQVLNQPIQEAEAIADRIISRSLAK